MERMDNLSVKRKIVVAICVLLCCIAAAFGTMTASFITTHAAENENPTAQETSEKRALREYTDITAELAFEGVKFYNDYTTGKGIKENLVVTGTYGGQSYTLYHDEYRITMAGQENIADDTVISVANVATFNLTVDCVTAAQTLSKTVQVEFVETLPTYTAITATASTTAITDDYNDEAFKKIITVTGTLEDGTTETLNHQLYTLSYTNPLTAGVKASVDVTYSTLNIAKPLEFTVSQAEVIGIAVTTARDVTLNGQYYVRADGYSAFVAGMTNDKLLESLSSRVFYTNSYEDLKFDAAGNVESSKPVMSNASARITNASTSYNAGSNTVELALQLNTGRSHTDSITLPFEARVIKEIVASYNYDSASVLYSYTQISTLRSRITVIPIYNDGTEGNALDEFTIGGSLAPTAAQIDGSVSLEEADKIVDGKYRKTIVISYISAETNNQTITAELTINGITFDEPTSISSITASTVTQTMTWDFNYTDMTVRLRYSGNNRFTELPLSELSDSPDSKLRRIITYYSDAEGQNAISSPDGTVPKEAKSASITVEYTKGDGTVIRPAEDGFLSFIPVQAPVDYPKFSALEADFVDGLTVDITGLNEYMVVTADTNPNIEVGEKVSYTEGEGDEQKTYYKTTLSFTGGGEYNVHVTIKGDTAGTANGADGVYRWADANIHGQTANKTGYTLDYKININKGEFDISSEYGDVSVSGDVSWTYGDGTVAGTSIPTPTVKGTIGSHTYTLVNQDSSDGLTDDKRAVKYKLYYYGWAGRTYDDVFDNGKVKPLSQIDGTLPKDVGTYSVIVVTEETPAYAPSVTKRWNAGRVTIQPKPLTVSNVLKEATYDRDKTYNKLADFAKTDGLVSGNGDTIDSVLKQLNTDGSEIEGDLGYHKAQAYEIRLVIQSDNYKWQDEGDDAVETVTGNAAAADVTFTIKKRELAFTASVTGFTYGDEIDSLTVSYTFNDDVAANENNYQSTADKFYAEIDDTATKYYKADSSGKPTGNAIDIATSKFNTWAAGNYVAVYSTKLSDTAPSGETASNTANTDDYNLPTANANFTVAKRLLTKIAYTSDINAGTLYDAKGHTVTFDNWETIKGELKNGDDIADIFTITIKGNRYDTDKTEINTAGLHSDGTVTLTEAGAYVITVKFKDNSNYMWSDADSIQSHTFGIHQREITIVGALDSDGKNWAYKYADSKPHYPTITLTGLDGHTLTPEIKYYKDSVADANEIAAAGIIPVGTYYVKITDFTCVGADKLNYKLPETVEFEFTINSAGLGAPALKDGGVGVVQDYAPATTYDIREFISNWSDFKIGTTGEKVTVEVYKNGETSLQSALQNVVYSGNNVTYYNVYLIPKDNYSWNTGISNANAPSGKAAYLITFTINPLEVELAWTKSTLTTTYSMGSQNPTVTVTNCGSDTVSVDLTYEKVTTDLVDGKAVNAGRYTVKASAVSNKNYKVSSSNEHYSETFIIKKATIDYPTVPTLSEDDAEWNGSATIAFTAPAGSTSYTWGDKFAEVLSVDVDGTIPDSWWQNAAADQKTSTVEGGTFDVTKGEFGYSNAGEYSFTFKIKDFKNYCWANDADNEQTNFNQADEYPYNPTATITIERKKLTPPDISADRAQEWDSSKSELHPINFGTATAGVSYGVTYGTLDATPAITGSSEWLGFENDGKTGKRGKYYAELKVTVGEGINPLNYVWIENTADTGKDAGSNGMGYVDEYATYIYRDGYVAIRLSYAVTSSQLTVDVEVKDYTFGDNGVKDKELGQGHFNEYTIDDATNKYKYTLDDNTDMIFHLTGADVDTAITADPKAVVKFIDSTGAEVTELVNGFPWYKGEYTAAITLTFGNGTVYQEKTFTKTFNVNALTLSASDVTWADLTHEYDTASHMATATLNASAFPKKTEDDTPAYTVELVVTLANDGNNPKNADSYDIKISNLTGADAHNFALPTAGIKNTLTITPKEISIIGVAVDGHVYGDTITDAEKEWKYNNPEGASEADIAANQFFTDGAANFITVGIYDTKMPDATTSQIGQDANVGGDYYVVVSWSASAGVHATNYKVTFDPADYNVIKRTLKVEFNSDNAESKYGEEVDLYRNANPIYKISADGFNGHGDKLAGLAVDAVFSFTCTGLNNTSVVRDDYKITPSAVDSNNFDITFVNADGWIYRVVNADITDKDNTIKAREGDWTYSASAKNVLADGYTAQTKNEQEVSWHYAEVDSADVEGSSVAEAEWNDFTKGNAPTVTNVGEYHYIIRATAQYHNPLYTKVTVTVTKATLTVSLNLSIWYGEANPDDVAGYMKSISDLRTRAIDNIGYTVSNFKGGDEAKFYSGSDFYGLKLADGVSALILTTDYNPGTNNGEPKAFYNLNIANADSIECDNYTFEATAGTLEVKKIMMSVAIHDVSGVVYNQQTALPQLTYTVTLPKSTYNTAEDLNLPDGNTYADIFSLASKATTSAGNDTLHNAAITTNNAGKYAIVGTNKIAAHYDISFSGSWSENDANKDKAGTYTVSPATLTVKTITGYEGDYDEHYHGLTVDDDNLGENDLRPELAATVDGKKPTIKYYATTSQVSNAANVDWANVTTTEDMPAYIDASIHYICYRITDSNHTTVYGVQRVRIIKAAENTLSAFSFKNNKQQSADTFDALKGDNVADLSAWIYGVYSDKATDGYNKDGEQAITSDPTPGFTRLVKSEVVDSNKLKVTVTLFYSPDGTTAATQLYSDITFNSAAALFKHVFATDGFNAGYYRLEFNTEDTDNYGTGYAAYVFRVGKRDLTVTAEALDSVVYGTEKSELTYTLKTEGLVSYLEGGNVETIEHALGVAPTFDTDYVAGNEVGKGTLNGNYKISVANKVANPTNYNVTYPGAPLTVIKRVVTITIDNQKNSYNLKNVSGSTEDPAVLTFKVAGGTFYDTATPANGVYDNDNQGVIKLLTQALASKTGMATNEVKIEGEDGYGGVTYGGYSIYATFVGNADNNYTIEFADCAFAESEQADAITQEADGVAVNNAGKYEIVQSRFTVVPDGVYHLDGKTEVKTTVYSGAVNYYKAAVKEDPNVTINFTYEINKGNAQNEKWEAINEVINVGEYRAIGKSSNTNYALSDVIFPITISQATLNITAHNATIQYGTPWQTTSDGSNNRISEFTYDSRAGVAQPDGTYTDAVLLETTIQNHLKANPVTYSTNYAAATSRAGEQNLIITPECKGNANIRIVPVSATLTVLKRDVTVTVNGIDSNTHAQTTYKGTQAATQAELNTLFANNIGSFLTVTSPYDDSVYGETGDGESALGVTLALPEGAVNVNADGYLMSYTLATGTNYNVTVTAGSPMFKITKAPLTLYSNALDDNKQIQSYSTTYGNAVNSTYDANPPSVDNMTLYLKFAVSGLQNGESFAQQFTGSKLPAIKFTVMNGAKAYEAWVSKVGETYTVTVANIGDSEPTAVELANYKITDVITAKLTLTARVITAATASQEYREDVQNGVKVYHDGVYGAAHTAAITFSGVNFPSLNQELINKTYRPKFGDSYDTKALSDATHGDYQVATEAPRTVGNWHVTVTLNDDNYVFEGNSKTKTLDFAVTTKVLAQENLIWTVQSIALDADENKDTQQFDNDISNFVTDIMSIDSFMFNATAGGGNPVEYSETPLVGCYSYGDGGKLTIEVNRVPGRYTVTFRLRNSATGNYELSSRNGSVVVSEFTVTSKSVTMTVEIDDWTYLGTPATPAVTVNGVLVSGNSGITFTYARITNVDDLADVIDKFYTNRKEGGYDRGEITEISRGTFMQNITFNAGYYLLSACYNGDVEQYKYCVFHVDKLVAEVPAPELNGYTYNGSQQELSIMYDNSVLRASYTGLSEAIDGGIKILGTNATDFTIRFFLLDSTNYAWPTDEPTVNGAVEFVWTIAPDDKPVDEANPYITLPDLSTTEYGAAPSFTPTLRNGYNGNVRYYYMPKTDNNVPSVDAAGWKEIFNGDDKLKNAGDYWVKAVVSDEASSDKKNYSDKATVSQLKVSPKVLTLTASGYMTYGDDWNDHEKLSYSDPEFVYSNDKLQTGTGFDYVLVGNPGKLEAGGEYYIVLDTDEKGVVKGLSAGSNYVIKAEAGRLTVNKRNITVNIGNAQSDYSFEPDLSGVQMAAFDTVLGSRLPGDDTVADLKIVLTTDATSNSPVTSVNNTYYITCKSYNNDNYNITFNPGTYIINRLRIDVPLTASNATYGDENITGVTVGELTSPNGELSDSVKADIEAKLGILYTGTLNDGTRYEESVDKPSEAGSYTAALTSLLDGNYELISASSVEFTIAKYTVDCGLISVKTKTYTGEAIVPELEDETYGSDYYEILESTYIDAGNHKVTLQLKDYNNMQWSRSVENGEEFAELDFEILRTTDSLTSNVAINGWAYGTYDASVNSPTAAVKSGGAIVWQYSADGKTFTAVVPETGNAGKYYVRAYVAQSQNYEEFISPATEFEIARYGIVAPTLTIVTEGEGKNDVFTGLDLQSAIVGYDAAYMQIAYDGRIDVDGNNVIVFAHDSDTYTVRLSLLNSRNYCWREADTDNDGTVELTWQIGRMKIKNPTPNTERFTVNGKMLNYLPEGFDESIMAIEGNERSYGGTFDVTVTLKDTKNYEWEDGSIDPITFEWYIKGAKAVFVTIVVTLSVLSAAAAGAIVVQCLLNKRKKRVAAQTMQDIENKEAAGGANA